MKKKVIFCEAKGFQIQMKPVTISAVKVLSGNHEVLGDDSNVKEVVSNKEHLGNDTDNDIASRKWSN